MKAILTCVFLVLLSGCGWSRSQTRIVSGPNGVNVRESSNCVGVDCGARSGMGYASYGAVPFYGWGGSPSDQRFRMIREYRSRNVWTRSGRTPSADSRGTDMRADVLLMYLRRVTKAMCRNGTMTGDDCSSEDLGQASEPVEAAGSTPDVEEAVPQTNSENEGEGQ